METKATALVALLIIDLLFFEVRQAGRQPPPFYSTPLVHSILSVHVNLLY